MRKITAIISVAAVLVVSSVANSADLSVDQLNKTFSQPSMNAKVGDSVTFKNGDDVTHNITVEDADGNGDDKGMQKPGENIVEKFTAAGDYVARCQIHPRMKMHIKVE